MPICLPILPTPSLIDANGHYDTDEPKVDFIFFGLVDGNVPELGYFTLSELQCKHGRRGYTIDRDRCFTSTALQVLIDECNKRNQI